MHIGWDKHDRIKKKRTRSSIRNLFILLFLILNWDKSYPKAVKLYIGACYAMVSTIGSYSTVYLFLLLFQYIFLKADFLTYVVYKNKNKYVIKRIMTKWLGILVIR